MTARAVRFASPACREALVAAVRHALPDEACGMLLGWRAPDADVIQRVVPAPNVHPRPRHAFEVDPGALVAAERSARADGLALLGFFHSHPTGPAAPSAADRAGGWRGVIGLIAAVEPRGKVVLRAFRSREQDTSA